MSMGGVILDFVLAGANVADKTAGEDLLFDLQDRLVVGDKGYISAELAAELGEQGVDLITLPRRNQKEQVSATTSKLLNTVRQVVETVNGQLVEQFHIQDNHAYSFSGLCARLYTKLTAHTICIKLNRLLGSEDFLQIKKLAFPN